MLNWKHFAATIIFVCYQTYPHPNMETMPTNINIHHNMLSSKPRCPLPTSSSHHWVVAAISNSWSPTLGNTQQVSLSELRTAAAFWYVQSPTRMARVRRPHCDWSWWYAVLSTITPITISLWPNGFWRQHLGHQHSLFTWLHPFKPISNSALCYYWPFLNSSQWKRLICGAECWCRKSVKMTTYAAPTHG